MKPAILCFGEVLLRLSAPGKELLLQSPRFDAHIGGAEANVAVSLHKFGHRTRVVSTLPDSTLGRACADELRRHGVETDAINFHDGRMGMYFLTHGAGHRPAEVLYDRSQSAFAAAAAPSYDWAALLQDARWLHVSGITPAVSAAAAEAASQAMHAARKAGVQISFDCNFRARLWGARAPEAPQLLTRLCAQADVIFGDDRDIAFMLDFKPGREDARREAADLAFKTFQQLRYIVCTERARSSVDVQQLTGLLFDSKSTYTSRSYPLHSIVDRIGSGDAFAAGVLHGLLTDMAPQAAIEFGAAAGCLKHSIPGDFNLLGVADVELLLSEKGGDVRR
ncbi:MAG: sugar kinase [Pseudomonadota bacterium]|nr:sugar kinase [Pseudomonadota bacterium]